MSKIVPNNRLLFWTGLILLPFSALASAVPSVFFIAVGVIVGLIIISATDALAGAGRGRNVSVGLDDVVRMSKGRKTDIEIRIANIDFPARAIKIGLPLPHEIYSPVREVATGLDREATDAVVSWPCKGLQHGYFALDRIYLEFASPLGLWACRRVIEAKTEIRVYPNLVTGQDKLAALMMNKKTGIHSRPHIGKGRDFERLREYVPGDNYEDIYWKATAKHRFPISKVFQIERSQDIYIVIDYSRLSARATGKKSGTEEPGPAHEGEVEESILDRYVTAALMTGISAEKHGDMYGVITFADKVRGIVRAKSGKAHYNACRDMLYTLQPENVTPDFSDIFTFICTRLRKRALLIFLTNLDDAVLSREFIRNINVVSRRHLVMVSMMRPMRGNPIFSSPDAMSVDDIYENFGGHFLWKYLTETGKRLKKYGIGFSLLDNETMFSQLVSQYLNIKQRQIL